MSTRLVKREGRSRSKPVEKKILPRVKFTGQQPGEEGVERDPDPKRKGEQDGHDVETDEAVDERGFPDGEPSTEGKFSA
jgi:hypothetical protein